METFLTVASIIVLGTVLDIGFARWRKTWVTLDSRKKPRVPGPVEHHIGRPSVPGDDVPNPRAIEDFYKMPKK